MGKKEIKKIIAHLDTTEVEKRLEEMQKKKLFINLDTSAAEKQCEELERKAGETEKVLNSLDEKKKLAESQIKTTKASLEAEQEKLATLKKQLEVLQEAARGSPLLAGPTPENRKAEAKIPEAMGQVEEQEAKVKALEETFAKLRGQAKEYKNAIGEAKQKLQEQMSAAGELRQKAITSNNRIRELCKDLEVLQARQEQLKQSGLGLGTEEYDTNVGLLASISQELEEYQANLEKAATTDKWKELKEKAKDVTDRIQDYFKKLQPVFKVLTASVRTVGKVIKSVFSGGLKAVGKVIKGIFSSGLKIIKNFRAGVAKVGKDNIFSKIGAKIKDTLITNGVKKGLSLLGSAIGQYFTENEAFTSSLEKLKGGLKTAFQPIFDAVIPALTALMDVMTRAIAVVGEFIAALFGGTKKQASDSTKELEKEADALGSAGAAAEEAAGSLAGFDEINTIQTEDKGGGGGSGSGGNGSSSDGSAYDYGFETTAFDSWGEAFSAFLDTILNKGIPQLKAGFERFSDWMNGISGKLYEMFKFEGVKDKVQQIGKELAGAFNELVAGIDWNTLGAAIGAGLNLAIVGGVSFLYSFDWLSLGASLAEAFNGLADAIDWPELGRLLWSGFKIGIETLAGFISKLDMEQLAIDFSNLAKSFFESVSATFAGIDWKQLGLQIVTFLQNVEWAEIGQAAAASMGEIFEAVREVFANVLVLLHDEILKLSPNQATESVWNALKEKLKKGNEAVTWVDIISGLTAFLSDIATHITAAAKDGEFGEFWGSLKDQIAAALGAESWDDLKEQINEKIRDVVAGALEIAGDSMYDAIKEKHPKWAAMLFPEKWQVDVYGEKYEEILANRGEEAANRYINRLEKTGVIGAEAAAEILANHAATALEGIGEVTEEAGNDYGEGFEKGTKDSINGSRKEYESAFGKITGWIKDLFGIHSPSTVMAEMGGYLIEGLVNGLKGIWNAVKDIFATLKTNIWNVWVAVYEKVKTAWDNVKTAISSRVGKIWSGAKEAFSTLKANIWNVWVAIYDKVKTAWDNVKNKISEKAGNIWSGIKGKLNTLKDNISEKFEGIKTKATEIFENLKTKVSDIWTRLKDALKTPLNGILKFINGMLSGIGNGINKIVDTINKLSFTVPNKKIYGDLAGQTIGFNLKKVTVPQIPLLAQGAVIPPNKSFLAVLGDQRNGNNLEAPEGLIRKIVREEAGGDNGELLRQILEAIRAGQVIQVDGTTFGRTAARTINDVTLAAGRPVLVV